VGAVFAHGQQGGSTQGTLTFTDSSTGWLVVGATSGTGIPAVAPYLYVTRDGGLTWQVQTISAPSGTHLDSSNATLSPPYFFNSRDGIMGLTPILRPTAASGASQPLTLEPTYLYRTSDGGRQWTYAVRLPASILVGPGSSSFTDARHWLLFDGSKLIRTTDGGQHWSAVPGGLAAGMIPVILTFTDQSNGWAVIYQKGPAGPGLYRTTDGGTHWSAVSLPSAG
jgi:photosystem II stability/assembly factor-like uncharacterized protein